ncbi:MAG: DUF559 domain-containing protein [Clostridia bacterium]|nr:DUF559 domain-containing protein [Clostridia bacterium]
MDFYIPQCRLVIEIDGAQHKEEANRILDRNRDELLMENGISTIRIDADDMRKRSEVFFDCINSFKEVIRLNSNNLNAYFLNFKKYEDLEEEVKKNKLMPVAIIRFQLLILKLIEFGYIKLDDEK